MSNSDSSSSSSSTVPNGLDLIREGYRLQRSIRERQEQLRQEQFRRQLHSESEAQLRDMLRRVNVAWKEALGSDAEAAAGSAARILASLDAAAKDKEKDACLEMPRESAESLKSLVENLMALSSKEDLLSSLSWTANQDWASWVEDVQRIENILVKAETEFIA